MRKLFALAVLACLTGACNDHSISARTKSTLINGGGAANTGVLNGKHLPDPGGG